MLFLLFPDWMQISLGIRAGCTRNSLFAWFKKYLFLFVTFVTFASDCLERTFKENNHDRSNKPAKLFWPNTWKQYFKVSPQHFFVHPSTYCALSDPLTQSCNWMQVRSVWEIWSIPVGTAAFNDPSTMTQANSWGNGQDWYLTLIVANISGCPLKAMFQVQ